MDDGMYYSKQIKIKIILNRKLNRILCYCQLSMCQKLSYLFTLYKISSRVW